MLKFFADRFGIGSQQFDQELFSKAITQGAARCYSACLRITRDPHLAEDALQDALLKAWKHRDQFRGDAQSHTWLHRIAIHCAIDVLRKEKPRLSHEPQVAQSAVGKYQPQVAQSAVGKHQPQVAQSAVGKHQPQVAQSAVGRHEAVFSEEASDAVDHVSDSPFQQLERAQLHARLQVAMRQLSDLERVCFVLKHLESYRLQEIAERLDCKVDRVKQALLRALQKLRLLLPQHEAHSPDSDKTPEEK